MIHLNSANGAVHGGPVVASRKVRIRNDPAMALGGNKTIIAEEEAGELLAALPIVRWPRPPKTTDSVSTAFTRLHQETSVKDLPNCAILSR